MKTLTDLTLSGAIGFEKSFRLRCAILRSISISVVQQIVKDVPLNDEIVGFIRKNSSRCFLVTGNLDVWIAPLVERIGCRSFSSTAVTQQDALVAVEQVLHKNEPILALKRGGQPVVAIGESVNDVPMYEVADISISFGGVHAPAQQAIALSHYVVQEGGSLCRLLNTL